MESPPSSPAAVMPFDSSKPFAGVVVCCTSIPPDQRTEIAHRTTDMGGVHKYDLTPEVTHLIVGDYDTAKYRHVARERPDITPMAAGWVDAVRDLWMADQEIDFAKLESEHKMRTLETNGGLPLSKNPEERAHGRLLCCLTGFEENERHHIEETVNANGGAYIGDLSRRVTHLIVCKPEGKKYQAAKNWGIVTVSIEWLHDSVRRGMILDEKLYDPTLPVGERGRGAIVRKQLKRVSLGKRARSATGAAPEDGQRKLRKTASMKINSQGNNIWGDIINKQSSEARPALELSGDSASMSNMPLVAESIMSAGAIASLAQPSAEQTQAYEGIFASCRFFVHGFPQNKLQIVYEHLSSHGAQLSPSLTDVVSPEHAEPKDQRFMLVPQASQPDTHPILPDGVHIVTEFYLERCIHGRQLFHPNEHALGRPFPRFPIDGFEGLIINSSGFRDEQLNQVEKTVVQLGAIYTERLNSQSSVLVCPSIGSLQKHKLDFAILSKLPVVNAEWLWQCISTGFLVPWDDYLFPELKQRLSIDVDPDLEKQRQKLQRSRSESALKRKKSDFRAPPPKAGLDRAAFHKNESLALVPKDSTVHRKGEESESHYESAVTHQPDSMEPEGIDNGPLSEVSSNVLNKPSGSPKEGQPARKTLRRFPTGGTIGDSEGGDESDATTVRGAEQEDLATAIAAAQKRKVDEARAAERQAMTSRLTSLIDTSGGPARAGSDLLARLPTAPKPRPQRRNREILGRAVSNVSATSSASVESSAHAAAGGSGRMDSVKSAPGALDLFDGRLEGRGRSVDREREREREEENKPSATQIYYDNPEARLQREAVMDQMLGNTAGKKVSGGAAGKPKGARDTTAADDLAKGNVNLESTAVTGTAASRRTRRR